MNNSVGMNDLSVDSDMPKKDFDRLLPVLDIKQEKIALIDWINRCWNFNGNQEQLDRFLELCFDFVNKNITRYTNRAYDYLLDELVIKRLNDLEADNENLIFDTEYSVLSHFNSYALLFHQMIPYVYVDKKFHAFKQEIKTEFKNLGPWSIKEVGEDVENLFIRENNTPQIVYSWMSVDESVNEENLFISSLFMHLFHWKCYEFEREIHNDLIEFSKKCIKARSSAKKKYGFLIDNSLIDGFKSPMLRSFAVYLNELDLLSITQEQAENKISSVSSLTEEQEIKMIEGIISHLKESADKSLEQLLDDLEVEDDKSEKNTKSFFNRYSEKYLAGNFD